MGVGIRGPASASLWTRVCLPRKITSRVRVMDHSILHTRLKKWLHEKVFEVIPSTKSCGKFLSSKKSFRNYEQFGLAISMIPRRRPSFHFAIWFLLFWPWQLDCKCCEVIGWGEWRGRKQWSQCQFGSQGDLRLSASLAAHTNHMCENSSRNQEWMLLFVLVLVIEVRKRCWRSLWID